VPRWQQKRSTAAGLAPAGADAGNGVEDGTDGSPGRGWKRNFPDDICVSVIVSKKYLRENKDMKIQSSVMVHLGYGKYVRSDKVTAVLPIEQERGPGRRTFVYVEGQKDPLVASRAEDSIVRDLVQEPREITQSRQQQEILRDLLIDLDNVNATVRRIARDEGLDLDTLERRIREVVEE